MNYGAYKNGRIIAKKESKLMQTAISDNDTYGLAIRTNAKLIPGKIMKGHTGSAYGLYSSMFFQPEEKFGVVAITNSCNSDEVDGTNPALKQVTNILYDSLIK
jgi:hypothetical protein